MKHGIIGKGLFLLLYIGAISFLFPHAAYSEDWITASFYRRDTNTLATRILLTNVRPLSCGEMYQTIERSTKGERDTIRRRAATGDYEAIQLLGWFDPKTANLYSAMFGDLNDLANFYGGLNWFEGARFRRVFKKLDEQVEKGDVDAAIRLYKFFLDGSFWVHWKGHDGDFWAKYYSDKISVLTSGGRRLPIKLRNSRSARE